MLEILNGRFGESLTSAFTPNPSLEYGRPAAESWSLEPNQDAELAQKCTSAIRLVCASLMRGPYKSDTFGDDNPLTTAWIAELAFVCHRNEPDWDNVRRAVRDASIHILSIDPVNPHSYFKGARQALEHSLPVLRAIHLGEILKAHDAEPTDLGDRLVALKTRAVDWFEGNLLAHLAYSSIPDSRFDPAELMFCLEGYLMCVAGEPDQLLLQRVMAALAEAQLGNAYWRPLKPILAEANGKVLFPVSVEIANALLRVCARIESEPAHTQTVNEAAKMLDRYYSWLRARLTNSGGRIGWHSEHVNDRRLIHLWETSFNLIYLHWYRKFVARLVARRGLALARVNVMPEKPLVSIKNIFDGWNTKTAESQPTSCLGSYHGIYERIKAEFIEPHVQNNNAQRPYSMLLYGPPGTGKTTIARNLAGAIGYPLITITVSDFLGSGAIEVEPRAKSIFDMLLQQRNCVVLFDEIDHMLLDRESKHYHDVDTVFQFMPPGMLTKLGALREKQNCIFIIATNFEDRIDPAIKRSGRIDHRYLVLPPDQRARQRLLQSKIKLILERSLEEEEIVELVKNTFMLSFSDVERRIAMHTRQPHGAGEITQWVNSLAREFAYEPRTTSLSSYEGRLLATSGAQRPTDEYFALIAMHIAEAQTIPEYADPLSQAALRDLRTRTNRQASLRELVEEGLRITGNGVVDGMVEYFGKVDHYTLEAGSPSRSEEPS